MIRAAVVSALIAATSLCAAGATLDEAPTGLIPTSTTLAKVHALYLRTHERERTRAATTIEEWRISQEKLVGTMRLFRLGRDERSITTLGPFTWEAGVRGTTRWQQTRNGITFPSSGVHEARDALSDRAWIAAPLDDPRDVRLIGESVALSAFVVELNPAGGRHEWIFVDKKSGNIVRREALAKGRRITTVYEDFRTFDGIAEPSRVRTIDSYGNERDQTLLSRTLDLTPDTKDVDVTASRRALVEFPAGMTSVRLPVRFVGTLPIVRVRVGVHSYDFLLDSGAAGIVVDPSVIDEQHLETYGSRVGSTIGTFNETTSIVPAMAVGLLKLHSTVVRVVGVPFRLDDRTRIAGLLGFDFFADAVIHLDLERGFVDALIPATFKAPSDTAGVALALDDRTPAVRARAGTAAGRMIIDTGSNRSILTTAFAGRADAVADTVPNVAKFRGVGGTGTAETVHVKSFDLGGIAVSDPVIDMSGADFGNEDVDGMAGTDLLRAYDLFFDYHSAVVYVRRARRGFAESSR